MSAVVALHERLVSIPSVSENEAEIADFCLHWLEETGAEVRRVGHSVMAHAGSGPCLVLNSHLDTVPAQPGWSSDPWTPRRVGDQVFGLGTNDAKASVAALMVAFRESIQTASGCRLLLMLAEGEELRGIGTMNCLADLSERNQRIDAAIVGEPTELKAGVGQFGLAVLRLVARGTACHAAHARALGLANPVTELAQDLVRIAELDLGDSSIQPTTVTGAEAHNQIPAEASAILDVRLAPGLQAETVIEAVRGVVKSEVEVVSTRLRSYAMPEGAPFWDCLPPDRFVSRTMSDQVFFQGIPAVKLGPGKTERSHTVDEFVLVSELEAGVAAYRSLIERFVEVYG